MKTITTLTSAILLATTTLAMQTEKIDLWATDSQESYLIRHITPDDEIRPAIIVFPGGGYNGICEVTEGGPVADKFDTLGFRTFVINYRTRSKGGKFPDAISDAMRAIRIIRGNAEKWHIAPDMIATCGFSAGGHLAFSLGTIAIDGSAEALAKKALGTAGDAYDTISPRPDAMLAGYPVILALDKDDKNIPQTHSDSPKNFFAKKTYNDLTAGELKLFSLDRHITDDTPPAFIYATREDEIVPCINTLRMAEALAQKQIPVDLHLYPHGPHGMQLGYGKSDIANWPEMAKSFLRDTCGFVFPEDPQGPTIILSFDDSSRTHLTHVAPLLKRYGFDATFFITHFDEKEHTEHDPSEWLTFPEVKTLHDMGFEIGNHSYLHHPYGLHTNEELEADILHLEAELQKVGIPKPTTYAYPGGHYSDRIETILKKHNYTHARALGKGYWDINTTNPYNIPAICYTDQNIHTFPWLFQGPTPEDTKYSPTLYPCIVLHGIPDLAHPYCSTSPRNFLTLLNFLRGHKFQVLSFRSAK